MVIIIIIINKEIHFHTRQSEKHFLPHLSPQEWPLEDRDAQFFSSFPLPFPQSVGNIFMVFRSKWKDYSLKLQTLWKVYFCNIFPIKNHMMCLVFIWLTCPKRTPVHMRRLVWFSAEVLIARLFWIHGQSWSWAMSWWREMTRSCASGRWVIPIGKSGDWLSLSCFWYALR